MVAFGEAFQGQLAELFRWRRDVRHFRPDRLPPGLLAELLALAALAPSVGLSQPWRFVQVDDPDRREAIRENFRACNDAALTQQSADRRAVYAGLKLAGLAEAPTHLAVFADPDPAQGGGLGRGTMPHTTAYSAVLAIHTLWLAARAKGLGLGWVSILDPPAVSAILDVSAEWQFVAYLCLGYPVMEDEQPELERLGWEARRPVELLLR